MLNPCNNSHTKAQDTVLFLRSVTLPIQWACSVNKMRGNTQDVQFPVSLNMVAASHRRSAFSRNLEQSGKLNCRAKVNSKSCRLPMCKAPVTAVNVQCSVYLCRTWPQVVLLPDSPTHHIHAVHIIIMADSFLVCKSVYWQTSIL